MHTVKGTMRMYQTAQKLAMGKLMKMRRRNQMIIHSGFVHSDPEPEPEAISIESCCGLKVVIERELESSRKQHQSPVS